MRTSARRAVLLASLGTFLLGASAAAQAVGNGTVSGSLEIGARGFTRSPSDQQLGKLFEYKDVPSGGVVQQFGLKYTTNDSLKHFELSGRRLGTLDQNLWFRATQTGLFDFQIRSDRIPHTFSTTARFLGSEPSPGVYTLPNPRPDTATLNHSAYVSPIRTRWDPVKLSLTLTPTPNWDMKAEFTHIDKTGGRPMGMAFGGSSVNAREIIEPIDQTIKGFRLMESYAREHAQFVGTYDLSVFTNGLSSVTSDNPLVVTDGATTGSSRGRTALAPSNVAHTVAGTGAFTLPLRTRVSTSLSYGWWRQNEPFIRPTINNAIVDTRLGAEPYSLGGEVQTSNFSASFSSRPIKSLNLTGHFRSYVFRDFAQNIEVPLLVVNDRSISPADSGERDPFRKDNADVGASVRLPFAFTLGGSYGYESMDLDSLVRNVKHYRETTPRATLDFTGIEWASLRATYRRAWRRTSDYHTTDGLTFTDFRRFDLADRDRERFNLLADVTPWTPVTVGGTWEVGHDRYPNSAFGIMSDKSTTVGSDVSYSVSTRVTLGVGYTKEVYDDLAHNRYRSGSTAATLSNPTWEWFAHNTDNVITTSGNARLIVIPEKLEVGGTYGHSRARFAMLANNPQTPTGGTVAQNTSATASDFPAVVQTLEPVNAYVQYRVAPEWAMTLRYQSELFGQNDFRTVGLQPATGNFIFLGNNFMNYNVRYLTLSFSYHPAPIRASRSTL